MARSRRLPILPLVILFLTLICAVLAPWIAPYAPTQGSLSAKLLPPAWEQGGNWNYVLGTDPLGRDILSRIIHGARVSLSVSLVAILVGGGIGTVIGLVAGYFGGWVDGLLMRITDIAFSLPLFLLAIVLATVLEPGLPNVIIAIALLIWAQYARQVRGETLSIRQRDFVTLARLAGSSSFRVIRLHILPNVANSLIVVATLQVGWVILVEAALSFLGVGVPAPQPAWGSMVATGRDLIVTSYWVSMFPGVAILLVVLSLNLFGDWLRDFLDPKLRQV